jgi:hypothetical protein
MQRDIANKVLVATIAALACATATPAIGQLRIVSYNAATVTNPSGDTARAGMSDVLQAIGIESKNGIQRPIDILSLQEVSSSLNGATSIVTLLNNIYGAGTYARSTVGGSSTDSTTQAVVYNTHTVQLVSQAAVGTASVNGAARAPMRYEFRPVGYDDAADFYLYSEHYKAGTTSSDLTRRNVEATAVRNDANSLGPGARVIFSGDFNIQRSSEQMYQTLTAPGGPGQAVDPINKPGTWNNSATFSGIHTQAPLVTGVNSLTGGGMDDRFDFQLTTAPMLSGQGVSYIGPNVPNVAVTPTQESYHAFGNNGTTFNSNINAPANTALPAAEYNPGPGQPTRSTVLNSLSTASDHLPVVADYQIPAKMNAALAEVPNRVIIGTPLNASVSVSNVAPVNVQIGADELTYAVEGAGAVSGATVGTSLALAAANVHNLALDTSSIGTHAGAVNVTSSSVAVANGLFDQHLQYDVLSHSAAEFVNPSAPHSLDINFGSLLLGSGAAGHVFQIANLGGTFTAGLDLDSFFESNDAANRFSTDLTLFSDLDPGTQSPVWNLLFQTDQLGTFTASYLLSLSDDDGVFGGTGGQTLALNVTGAVVVPEPASWIIAGIAGVAVVAMRRCGLRRRKRN